MAAQGKTDTTICERCFASVKGGAEFCPECGAPMGKGPAEGSDAAIYPELARANLLRMRGDYAAALDQCRSILRKFPNNVTANQLLGDICVETDDLEQAKEWYELSLDIAPNSETIEKKLNSVKQKLEHRETEGLVEQLGLPPTKSRGGLLALGLAVLVLGVGAIAYVIGMHAKTPASEAGPKMTSVSAPPNQPKENPNSTGETTGTATPPTNTPTNEPVATAEERSLSQLIAQRSAEGAKLVGLAIDPRSGLLTLTYIVGQGDDERAIAAKLAEAAFDNSPTTRVLTVRALRDGTLTYTADAHRETYEETKTDVWKSQNGNDPGAAAKHFLTQEWTPGGASATTGGTSDAPPDNTQATGNTTGA